jgi:tetratricopeptide (TPR) repeat protein
MALYWDWTGAQALFDRAIDRSFGEAAYSSTWYTSLLAVTGRIREAIEIRSREVAHSPQDVGPRVDLALLQIIAAHYREAEDTLRLSLDEPARKEHYQLYMLLAILHGAEGDFQAAVRAINKVPMATSESTITMGLRPLYDGLAGHRDRAAMEYKRMVSMRQSSFVPASQIAFAAIGASDYEAAVSWLTEAVVNERDPFLVLIGLLPFLAPLHAHAGFRALVTETMNLTLTLRS